MTERHKWMILTGLVPALGITLVLRFGHRPETPAGESPDGATAPGAPGPDADLGTTSDREDEISAAPALELARALLARPAAESQLPRRDLFAPARGEVWSGEAGTGPGNPGEDHGATAPGAASREDGETRQVAAPTQGPLSLTATFQDGAVRMALLGGALVREGDAVRGGYVLSKVEESRVTLTRGKDVLVVDMPAR